MEIISFFETTKRLNKRLLIMLVLYIVCSLLNNPTICDLISKNALGILINQPQSQQIIAMIGLISNIYIWLIFGLSLRMIQSKLQWAVFLYIASLILYKVTAMGSEIAFPMVKLYGIEMNFPTFNIVQGILNLVQTVAIIIISIGLIRKFSGRISLLGKVIISSVLFSMLVGLLAYVFMYVPMFFTITNFVTFLFSLAIMVSMKYCYKTETEVTVQKEEEPQE